MISFDGIVNFIVPAFFLPGSFLNFSDDILQTVFFTTIFFLFIVTLLTVLINAKEGNWNKKWYKQGKNKRFNAEYITVGEVSEAAETKSEKLANAMPSILLTIGLLGTFIGLGIALDKASAILANTEALDNTENQMIQLMAMLDGLGAKFKTSTWGLSAFILLKFILSFIGYESKRLEWSANKVKEELDSIQKNEKEERTLRDTDLSSQLNLFFSKITQALLDSQSENKTQLVNIANFTREVVSAVKSENLQQSERFEKNIMIANDRYESLEVFLSNIFNEIKSESALQASRFDRYVSSSNKNTTILFDAVNESVNRLIVTTNKHQEVNESLQNENIAQGKDVRDSMLSFIEKNEKVVNALSTAATNMSGAATEMGQSATEMGKSATQLEIVISNLRTDMEGVIGLLKNDLSASIADMNKSFSENMGSMTSDLQETITDMNKSFKFNISEMSGNLKDATEDISDAVKSLSASVEKTMSEVTKTINESMDLQAKAQKESSDLQVRAQSVFTESTDNLNRYILEMTGLVNKLSGDIVNGLNAVSTSNRSMVGLTKKVEALFEALDGFSNLNKTLEGLVETLKLEMNIDFTSLLARKTQHHTELLFKIEQLIKSTDDVKDNISDKLITALQYRKASESESATQEI